MNRPRLKSKFGCTRCRERRRKCDEVKPVCGDCDRLGFRCRWAEPSQPIANSGTCTPSSSILVLNTSKTNLNGTATAAQYGNLDTARFPIAKDYDVFFDRPSVLRTNAVPFDGTADCKQILQYLSEKGGLMLMYPAQNLPANHNINAFRAGFAMASRNPVLHQAHLCLGAGHLSTTQSGFESIALKYYNNVLSELRHELQNCLVKGPAEWACGVAAVLAFYEKVGFYSPQSRLAHLVGYHRLVEARLYHKLPWGPTRVLLEQYVNSLIVGSLFHYEALVGQKPIDYVENVIHILDSGVRPLGREIVGVPEELTAVVYRLTVLNNHDIRASPWDVELLVTVAKLSNWTPAPHTLSPSGSGLLLVAKLYNLACTCLLRNIISRDADAEDGVVSLCLLEASTLIGNSQSGPFNCMMWPLTIFLIFAVDPLQKSIFTKPITTLIDTAKVRSYRSVLELSSLMEKKRLGPKVLMRPDILSMVYL